MRQQRASRPAPEVPHRLQPDPEALAPPAGRGLRPNAQAPRSNPRSTPLPQSAGGRSFAMTALIVGGSVVVGAVIGSVVLSLL